MGLIKRRRRARLRIPPPRVEQLETTGEERLAMILPRPPGRHPAGWLAHRGQGGARLSARSCGRARPRGLVRGAGMIAGDDTVFIAFDERASLQRILKRLLRLAG